MSPNPIAGTNHRVDPDQIVRIDISRSVGAATIEVRVSVASASEPIRFEFDSMAAAIEFYERLWSQRSASGDSGATPNIA